MFVLQCVIFVSLSACSSLDLAPRHQTYLLVPLGPETQLALPGN